MHDKAVWQLPCGAAPTDGHVHVRRHQWQHSSSIKSLAQGITMQGTQWIYNGATRMAQAIQRVTEKGEDNVQHLTQILKYRVTRSFDQGKTIPSQTSSNVINYRSYDSSYLSNCRYPQCKHSAVSTEKMKCGCKYGNSIQFFVGSWSEQTLVRNIIMCE